MSLSTAQAHYVAETSLPELHAHVRVEFGTVLLRQQSSVHVRVSHGKVRAEVAIGCLCAPAIGDRVLGVSQDDEAYVLSVLRSEQDETVLEFDRELSVRVKGTLRVL